MQFTRNLFIKRTSLFLLSKKDKGQRTVINLKELNQFIPNRHLKTEGLCLLKGLLEEGEYFSKLDFKDVYFCVPLNKYSQNVVRFEWKDFLSLCLPSGEAASISKWYQKLLQMKEVTVKELSSLLDTLISTALAILPALL